MVQGGFYSGTMNKNREKAGLKGSCPSNHFYSLHRNPQLRGSRRDGFHCWFPLVGTVLPSMLELSYLHGDLEK